VRSRLRRVGRDGKPGEACGPVVFLLHPLVVRKPRIDRRDPLVEDGRELGPHLPRPFAIGPDHKVVYSLLPKSLPPPLPLDPETREQPHDSHRHHHPPHCDLHEWEPHGWVLTSLTVKFR
jgi:hypothetical protein